MRQHQRNQQQQRGGSNCHRIAGGMKQNKPQLTVAKEEETAVAVRPAGLDNQDQEREIN